MRRRAFITLLGGAAAAWPLAARAQQRDRMRRLGILMGLSEGDAEGRARVLAVRQSLQDAGWTQGRNLQIDERWGGAEEERVKAFAKELVVLQPDVIIAHSTPVLAALIENTHTIPIVFVQVADPVRLGFIRSFAKPGGNVTGFTNYEYETIAGKWLEMLKEIAPSITRSGIVFNPDTSPYRLYLSAFEAAGTSIGLVPTALATRDAADVERAIDGFAREPKGALVILPDIFTAAHRALITHSLCVTGCRRCTRFAFSQRQAALFPTVSSRSICIDGPRPMLTAFSEAPTRQICQSRHRPNMN